jgi:choline dehydrogenase
VWDLFLFPALDPPGPEGYEGTAAVFAMKPWSRGTVRLTSPDPRAPLAIDHGFLTDERDVAVLVDGVEALRSLAASDEVRPYAGRETRPGVGVDAERHIRAAVRGFFHPVGTCAIGAVVDGDGRVRGCEGLWVCDASIMRSIPRANTNLSTIAVAERVAERLLAVS